MKTQISCPFFPAVGTSLLQRGLLRLLTLAIILGASGVVAETRLQAQGFLKSLQNTPFDPNPLAPLRLIPRHKPSSSNLGVDENVYTHYQIDDNGDVWTSQHSAGGRQSWRPMGRRADVRYNNDGTAYFYFENADNRPPAPQFDRLATSQTAQVQNAGPQKVVAYHRDANSGAEYTYDQRGGVGGFLNVNRGPIQIHVGRFKAEDRYDNRRYFRYDVLFIPTTAPAWARVAVAEGRYEIWFPHDGNGVVYYSADHGRTFIAEENVPPAGLVSTR